MAVGCYLRFGIFGLKRPPPRSCRTLR